ncbi:hypothetical protein [Paenibacillus sacheonensis]|uniref:Uncharacterized protein n=1 Tax=Paenibacillus sacheonensis TaxID=742054 RepID=A0A7X4YLS5_9BACL|nr:hypothetical protein [Paenibacillus sacheonensis]MBM7566038.1 hypothetical protein [Paenibacillus sacheonensis]NBC68650.1 hypothetical protein [Paenibacillus sacheonensis]
MPETLNLPAADFKVLFLVCPDSGLYEFGLYGFQFARTPHPPRIRHGPARAAKSTRSTHLRITNSTIPIIPTIPIIACREKRTA